MDTQRCVHVDFETNGLDAHDPEQSVYVVGLAQEGACLGFIYANCTQEAKVWFWKEWVPSVTSWCAYNSQFDGAWMYRYAKAVDAPNPLDKFEGCSFMLYRLLTSEGNYGQSYTLEDAQAMVLGWDVRGQKAWLKSTLTDCNLAKKDMYKLTHSHPEQFTHYCAIDAAASHQLWDYMNWRCEHMAALKNALSYHKTLQMAQLRRVIPAQFKGMLVDREGMQQAKEELQLDIAATEEALRQHPKCRHYVEEWEQRRYDSWEKRCWRTKKVWAKKKDRPWETEGWLLDREKIAKTTWQKEYGMWYKLVTLPVSQPPKKPDPFNWGGKAVNDMVYNHIFTVQRIDRQEKCAWVKGVGRVPVTEKKMEPVLSKEVYSALGEVGKLLLKRVQLCKELSYVDAYLESSSVDGLLHWKLRPGATSNGRCGGG